jgi:hypothetical protein
MAGKKTERESGFFFFFFFFLRVFLEIKLGLRPSRLRHCPPHHPRTRKYIINNKNIRIKKNQKGPKNQGLILERET